MLRSGACFLLIAGLLGACSAPEAEVNGSLFATRASQQWRLPETLRELSGLATTTDGRLFAHADEEAVLVELDPRAGRVLGFFSVGDPERGDFEGVAITPDGDFWLATSDGRMLRFREGANGARVDFERFDSGLGQVCEIEGLAYLAAEQSLILACKENHARDMRATIALYAWRPGEDARLWRSMPESVVTTAAGVRRFRPSAIEFDAATGRTLLLSARDAALAELDASGTLLSARALRRRNHAQAEGLAVSADGDLIVGDEAGSARAALSVYARQP